ncbi:hypothetical protein T06_2983 [Trichinella sp. T6]|nr:hypothetical protein T06_2983 [Trichinella sp. T6]
MHRRNVSGRFSSDLRALLIADFIRRVSNHVRRERKETIEQFKILYLPITHGVSEKRLREQSENSVPNNHAQRERKETIEQLNILYLPITHGVSEKRLREQILDEMRSDTQPR